MTPNIKIDILKIKEVEHKDGEPISQYLRDIIESLMGRSVERQLQMPFTENNQQSIAEEIGYRNALTDILSFFQEN